MQTPSLTRQQTLVLNALIAANEPVSAYALLDQLREEGLRAPPQIYRALDKLVAYGLAHKLDSLNAFVACAHPHGHAAGPTFFAICTACGAVEEFSDPRVAGGLEDWSTRHGFAMDNAKVEVRGLCRQCQASA